MSALYVYGVVAARTAAPADLHGVADSPVGVVTDGALAALVSPLAGEELRPRRRDVRAHLDVLQDAFDRATVLPCRFGTVFDSEDAVRDELLAAHREELVEDLRRLEGRAQLRLLAVHDEETALRELVAAEPGIRELRERTRRDPSRAELLQLGELVAATLQALRERDAETVVAAVAPVAESVVVEEPSQRRVLSASLLVDRRRIRPVEEALEDVARSAAGRLRVELVGPLPPTAFVGALGGEVAAWA